MLTRPTTAMAMLASAMLAAAGCSAAPCGVVTATTAAADITDYRGDLARTGRMPGPAPTGSVQVLWRFTGPSPVTLPPAVVARQVLVPGDRSLMALDLATGATTWSIDLGATLNAPVTVAEGTAYATTADGVTHAIDLRRRQERWRFPGAVDGAQVSLVDATIYLGSRQRDLVALDPADGRRRWSVHVGHNVSRLAIADGQAYVGGEGSGVLTAVDLRRQRTAWSFDTGADRIVTPVIDQGTVFVAGVAAAGLAGRGTNLFALDAQSGARKWTFAPPDDPPMSSFAVGDRDVFIGTDVGPGTLYAVARSTGALTWQRPVPGPVDRPALVGDTLYVASGHGGLLALDIGTGRQRWAAAVDGYAEGVVLTGGLAVVASRDATDAAGTVTAFTDHSRTARCGCVTRASSGASCLG